MRVALVSVLMLTAAFCAPAGAAANQAVPLPAQSSLDVLGETVLAVVGAGGGDAAADQLRQSLALFAASYRIGEARERAATGEPAAAEEDPPSPATTVAQAGDPGRPPAGYGDGEVEIDPANLPPASAGSNGTVTKATAISERQDLFARTPVASDPELTSILLTGIALAPPNAPEAVQGVINNANTIVGRPYIWGGGHGSWYSHGYDCSGAVSFALFGGGLIPRPLTSGELEGWGAPGPGRWITVYANATHTFAVIAGLRWDTSGTERGTGPRWHVNGRPSEGFVARHPPGL